MCSCLLEGRHKIGIKDRDQIPFGRSQPFFKRTGLEAVSIGAMEVVDWLRRKPLGAGCIARDHGGCHVPGLVSRVIQYLDFKAVTWVL